jgi:drug/metabolite transporter (DMT)-like permease
MMLANVSPHLRAVLSALFVTLLWSTSWVLIKIGLDDIPALTFAGLRYTLAWCCLLPVAWARGQLAPVRTLARADWARLTLLGLLFYTVTQGAQFAGLDRLPAATTSLLLSFTTVIVALIGIGWIGEQVTRGQWIGMGIALAGAGVYFGTSAFASGEALGLLIVGVGVLANALSVLLGRQVNRAARLSPLTVTVVSMGIGAWLLLIIGIAVQGLPALNLQGVLIIGWLAVVNTAFAFTLWNHTQRTLPAVETSIINNTMLIQIAVLAWVFLGETLALREIAGLALAAVGTLVVQVRRSAG